MTSNKYITNIILGVSMAIGEKDRNFTVSVIAQVCDSYGECAISNIISMQVIF